MTGFLASVATLDEMDVAREGGADIVDLKDPSRGALGAWDSDALEAAVARWCGWGSERPMLSATIGDQPMLPERVIAAAKRIAETGVPIVKLGVFADGDAGACISALKPLAQKVKLISVFFGDLGVNEALLDRVADSGFYGAMIDTADKAAGGLQRHLDDDTLSRFVRRAKALGLVSGLAGSLKLDDIPPLAAIGPDYLGFRGALCDGGRVGRLDEAAVARVASQVRAQSEAA